MIGSKPTTQLGAVAPPASTTPKDDNEWVDAREELASLKLIKEAQDFETKARNHEGTSQPSKAAAAYKNAGELYKQANDFPKANAAFKNALACYKSAAAINQSNFTTAKQNFDSFRTKRTSSAPFSDDELIKTDDELISNLDAYINSLTEAALCCEELAKICQASTNSPMVAMHMTVSQYADAITHYNAILKLDKRDKTLLMCHKALASCHKEIGINKATIPGLQHAAAKLFAAAGEHYATAELEIEAKSCFSSAANYMQTIAEEYRKHEGAGDATYPSTVATIFTEAANYYQQAGLEKEADICMQSARNILPPSPQPSNETAPAAIESTLASTDKDNEINVEHFLKDLEAYFNSLTSINWDNDVDTTEQQPEDMANQTNDLVRACQNTITHCSNNFTQLTEEIRELVLTRLITFMNQSQNCTINTPIHQAITELISKSIYLKLNSLSSNENVDTAYKVLAQINQDNLKDEIINQIIAYFIDEPVIEGNVTPLGRRSNPIINTLMKLKSSVTSARAPYQFGKSLT